MPHKGSCKRNKVLSFGASRYMSAAAAVSRTDTATQLVGHVALCSFRLFCEAPCRASACLRFSVCLYEVLVFLCCKLFIEETASCRSMGEL